MTRSFVICAGLVAVGGLGLAVQVVLLREIMAAYAGNEFSAGVVMAVWIAAEALGAWLWGRFGARTPRTTSQRFLWTGLASIVVSVLAVPALLTFRPALGLVPAEALSIPALVALTATTLFLPAFSHGSLFTLAAQLLELSETPQPAGTAYLWEGLGTVLAAGLLSFWLITRLSSLSAIALFAIPLAMLLPFLFEARPLLRFVFGLLTTILLATAGMGGRIERWCWARHWPGQRVVTVANSSYGKVIRLEREDQQLVLFNGLPVLALPPADPGRIEELLHLPLLAHPGPERVLILGQALGGGIAAALHEPVSRLVTVQLDPLLVEELRATAGRLIEEEIADPRVELIIADPRNYLRQTADSFDCIILTDAAPQSLSANRLFTREFFALCRSRLRPGGILATPLPGGSHLAPDAAALLSVRRTTLAQIFPSHEVIAADFPLILASDRPIPLSPETIAARFRERRPLTRILTLEYLEQLLDPLRQHLAQSPLRPTPNLNHDLGPTELFLNMVRENRLSSPHFAALYQRFGRSLAGPLLPMLLALLVILTGTLGGIIRSRPFAAGFVILTSGYAGAALSTLILFGFQMRFGSVYSQVALLLATFMLGTVLGSWLGLRLARSRPIVARAGLAGADVLLAVTAGLVPVLALRGTGPWFMAAAGSTGISLGAQFPIAAALRHQPTAAKAAGRTAGVLFALDLAGGVIGSLSAALLLVPVLGLVTAALTVGVVKLASLMAQLGLHPHRLARHQPNT